METGRDASIVEMLFARDETALDELKKHYAAYCRKTAAAFLSDERDAEECINDVWLAAWNSIPPQKPQDLATYLGKLTRRAAIDRIRHGARQKRRGIVEALEEFDETIPSPETVEETFYGAELSKKISEFLFTLPETERAVFLRRYWYGDALDAIRRAYGLSKSGVKMKLLRTREKLRDYLKKEGYEI
ncbi:MAG: RNA polymerase sigma factor [Clostridia bacterium]|nr:RNA polymerase sigma factor [Clostridia bacterium]